jgi:hypothetical protein
MICVIANNSPSTAGSVIARGKNHVTNDHVPASLTLLPHTDAAYTDWLVVQTTVMQHIQRYTQPDHVQATLNSMIK